MARQLNIFGEESTKPKRQAGGSGKGVCSQGVCNQMWNNWR